MELAKNLRCNELEHLEWGYLNWLSPNSNNIAKIFCSVFYFSSVSVLDESGFDGKQFRNTMKPFEVYNAASFNIDGSAITTQPN